MQVNMEKLKLTEPQELLLIELYFWGKPKFVGETYPPAIKLVEHGLAEWEQRDGRLGRYTQLALTQAGIDWAKRSTP